MWIGGLLSLGWIWSLHLGWSWLFWGILGTQNGAVKGLLMRSGDPKAVFFLPKTFLVVLSGR